jgi:hypothetical protein
LVQRVHEPRHTRKTPRLMGRVSCMHANRMGFANDTRLKQITIYQVFRCVTCHVYSSKKSLRSSGESTFPSFVNPPFPFPTLHSRSQLSIPVCSNSGCTSKQQTRVPDAQTHPDNSHMDTDVYLTVCRGVSQYPKYGAPQGSPDVTSGRASIIAGHVDAIHPLHFIQWVCMDV